MPAAQRLDLCHHCLHLTRFDIGDVHCHAAVELSEFADAQALPQRRIRPGVASEDSTSTAATRSSTAQPILAQVGLQGVADLQVRNGVIEIRPLRRNPREGWADDARPRF